MKSQGIFFDLENKLCYLRTFRLLRTRSVQGYASLVRKGRKMCEDHNLEIATVPAPIFIAGVFDINPVR